MVFIQGGLLRRLKGKNLEPALVVSGTAAFAVGLLGVALVRDPLLVLLPLALIAVGAGFVTPSLTSLMSQRSEPSEMGQTLGAGQAMGALARIAGPVAAGFLYAHSHGPTLLSRGPRLPYIFAAALMGLALLLALNLRREAREAPEPVLERV
jgi:MFS transporter, DHA1 family, tetracycline resistance protein